jgi:hypothetical protein
VRAAWVSRGGRRTDAVRRREVRRVSEATSGIEFHPDRAASSLLLPNQSV